MGNLKNYFLSNVFEVHPCNCRYQLFAPFTYAPVDGTWTVSSCKLYGWVMILCMLPPDRAEQDTCGNSWSVTCPYHDQHVNWLRKATRGCCFRKLEIHNSRPCQTFCQTDRIFQWRALRRAGTTQIWSTWACCGDFSTLKCLLLHRPRGSHPWKGSQPPPLHSVLS